MFGVVIAFAVFHNSNSKTFGCAAPVEHFASAAALRNYVYNKVQYCVVGYKQVRENRCSLSTSSEAQLHPS